MNRESLWAILFPKQCPFCGKTIPYSRRACPLCENVLPFLPKQPDTSGLACLDGLSVPFAYEGAAEDAIRRLKFENPPAAARRLAPYMAEALPEGLHFDAAVPIPMTRRHLQSRGYNQAALLAQFTGKALGIPWLPVLTKIRDTKEQHTLGAKERRKNLKDAYALKRGTTVKGLRLLLCDDVVTTGATLEEAAAALKQAGAASVYGLALAQTLRRAESPAGPEEV